ncbi:MAG: penicillin-binding protein 2 [Armatimonadota bacterium]
MALPQNRYRPGFDRSDRLLRVLMCGFGLICCRLIYNNIIRHEYFMEEIAPMIDVRSEAPTPYPGSILSRNREPLAESVLLSRLVADPARMLSNSETFEGVASQLEKLIDRPAADIRDALNRAVENAQSKKPPRESHYCPLAEYVSKDTADKIKDLRITGLALEAQWKREYPQRELACHLLGGRDRFHQPLSGLEWQYRLLLDGTPGALSASSDPLGLAGETAEAGINAVPGKDLVLTLDMDLQRHAEDALNDMWRRERPKWASCVVIDPRTGGILAMAARPGYDPSAYVIGRPAPGHRLAAVPQEFTRNIPVIEPVEPGSTFKLLLTAAALSRGVITLQSTFYCPGHINIGGRPITCWGKWAVHGHGTLNVAGMLAQSCNICAAQIALKLGAADYCAFLEKCGIGQDPEAGFTVPRWALGIIRPPEGMPARDLATMGFGQNVSCTALQLTAAVSGIVNGGIMKHPHIVERVLNKDASVFRQPKVSQQVLCPSEVSATIRDMMENTVLHGTGATALMPGYRVGAKTGTAQQWDAASGRHYSDRYMVSFIETAPADAPRYVIYVACNEPKVGQHGSDVCGPVAKRIADYALRHLDKAPAQATAAPVAAPVKH